MAYLDDRVYDNGLGILDDEVNARLEQCAVRDAAGHFRHR